MTIWFDYTTTLRNTGRSGIANVEWSIGEAWHRIDPSIRALAMTERGKLVEIDPDSDLASTVYATDEAVPATWVTAAPGSWRDDVRAGLTRLLGSRSTTVIRGASAVYQLPRRVRGAVRREPVAARERSRRPAAIAPGDVVVSMGADWSGKLARRLAAVRESSGCRVVTMVYDTIPLTHPHLAFHNDPELFTHYYRSLVGASDLITCISRQSRDDLERFAAGQGLALPPTDVLRLAEVAGAPVRAELANGVDAGEFFLWVGTIERRKNLELLYDALRILESEQRPLPTVVVVGSVGWGVDDVLAEIRLGVTAASRAFVLLGSVDDRTLDSLYRRARALVFPSHYEGWGLPVREALIRGCPVAAGDSPAVREAADGSASVVLLPVDDAGPWADFLVGEMPPRPTADPVTWEHTARQLVAAMERIGTGSAPQAQR